MVLLSRVELCLCSAACDKRHVRFTLTFFFCFLTKLFWIGWGHVGCICLWVTEWPTGISAWGCRKRNVDPHQYETLQRTNMFILGFLFGGKDRSSLLSCPRWRSCSSGTVYLHVCFWMSVVTAASYTNIHWVHSHAPRGTETENPDRVKWLTSEMAPGWMCSVENLPALHVSSRLVFFFFLSR